MIRRIALFISLVAIFGSLCFATVFADDKLSVLVVADDKDKDSLHHNGELMKAVLEVFADRIAEKNFNAVVVPASARTNARRPIREILKLASDMRSPAIDVVLAVKAYNFSRKYDGGVNGGSRISGVLYQVQSPRRLAGYEAESNSWWSAPDPCAKDCIFDHHNKENQNLAGRAGRRLADELSALSIPASSGGGQTPAVMRDYTLTFLKFSDDDIYDAEEYLVIFRGYKRHSLLKHIEGRAEFWYQSTIKTERLIRNLNKMAEKLAIRVDVKISGAEVVVRKTGED